jgi:monoamine oxidase
MSVAPKPWDGEQVRTWLESRIAAARLDQAAADQRGYSAQDDYDKAAAEEWACRAVTPAARKNDQAAFADRLKQLLTQDEYPVTGIYDDRRFERHVRACLRKLAGMTKANTGFENTLRYQ